MQRTLLTLSIAAVTTAIALTGCADSATAPSSASAPTTAAQPPAQSEALVAPASTIDAATLAASIRLRCERRSNRSRISVDASNLVPGTGRFRARVTAAGGTVTSPLKRAVGGEDEFDFDSNQNDIRAGATAIASNFIRARSGPDVVAKVLNAAGQVVATKGADCTFR